MRRIDCRDSAAADTSAAVAAIAVRQNQRHCRLADCCLRCSYLHYSNPQPSYVSGNTLNLP